MSAKSQMRELVAAFVTALAQAAHSDHLIVAASIDGTVSMGGQVEPNTP